MQKELIIFVVINVGLALVLNALQMGLPGLFLNLSTALAFAFVILVANLHRFRSADSLRGAYAVITVLNIATLILAGNVAFLASLRSFYVMLRSFL